MSDTVTYRAEGDVALVTMDDGKVNAFSFDLIEQLGAAFKRAAQEGLAVVLTGRPGVLSGGLDLKVMKSGAEGVRKMLKVGLDLYIDIYNHPRPVIVACNGHALAGGAVLLLSGDTRIAAAGEGKIGLTEVAVGLTMPRSLTVLARDRLSRSHLTRVLLEAEVFTPEGAREAGFVDRIVPPESLLEEALAHAKKLAALPREPFAETKAMLRGGKVQAARRLLAEEIAVVKGLRP